MTITVNGQTHDLPEATTVRQLVERSSGVTLTESGSRDDGQRLGVAVAVDQRVVPRGSWHTTTLHEGQQVDIVTAVQGG